MREYDEYEKRDILNAAYADVEAGPLEVRQPCPDHEDALIRHQALRERSRDYETLLKRGQPPPRQVVTQNLPSADASSLSLSANGNSQQADWKTWVDEKISDARTALCLHVSEVMGTLFEKAGQRVRKVESEVATLRREITKLQNQIKALHERRRVEASIVSWHINRAKYSATPFGADGRAAGPPIRLRPLFEWYHQEAGHDQPD
jgi:hypothetical protein